MANERDLLVLGLMSGSSLDGLDMALCRFRVAGDEVARPLDWSLLAADTLTYPGPWRARLRQAIHLPGRELWRLHRDFGHYLGQAADRFLAKSNEQAFLVGSHGHTLFHDPKKGFTTQIGDGASLAAQVQLPTVTELRTADMALGGQGAPIAPIADHYLFPQYGAFLNLGGIANICVRTSAGRTYPPGDESDRPAQVQDSSVKYAAGDVTGANQVLDRLARMVDASLNYDPEGQLAARGSLLPDLLTSLEELPYHQQAYPKSLDNAWVTDLMWPVVEAHDSSPEDRLHTCCHFLANQINQDLLNLLHESTLPPQPVRVFVSGGGARNEFLLRCLRALPQDDRYPLGYATEADPRLGDFKEAAMVGLMALLRYFGQSNSFGSATGASRDAINGALYLPVTNRQT